MDRYQEAYSYIKHYCELDDDFLKWPLAERSMKVFKELVDANKPLTLDECIKEWEKRGFIVNSNDLYIFLHHEQHRISLFIHKEEIKYHIYYGYIPLEVSELLTKTLKALEVNKNEKKA